MTDIDMKLIDDAVNNKLKGETLSLFNSKMKEKEFRNAYLNYLLDETLLTQKLEELNKGSEEDKDLEIIYDALNSKLPHDNAGLFEESLKEDEFRAEYLNFVLDEKLLEQSLEKQKLSSVKTKRRLQIISSAILAAAAAILIFLNVSAKKGLVHIDRVYQAWILRDGREIAIGKATKLKAGDHIKVNGSLTIVYPDKTEITVNDKSEIILGDLSGNKVDGFELLKGYLTVNTGSISGSGEVKTKFSKAVFAESTFTLSIVDEFSTIEVHRGEVEFFNNFGSNDLIAQGQQAWVKDKKEVNARQVYIDNVNSKHSL